MTRILTSVTWCWTETYWDRLRFERLNAVITIQLKDTNKRNADPKEVREFKEIGDEVQICEMFFAWRKHFEVLILSKNKNRPLCLWLADKNGSWQMILLNLPAWHFSVRVTSPHCPICYHIVMKSVQCTKKWELPGMRIYGNKCYLLTLGCFRIVLPKCWVNHEIREKYNSTAMAGLIKMKISSLHVSAYCSVLWSSVTVR